ncbi:hypothetical protein [Streptomyces sp. URMC 123]|uniref:hypothetical protein n=1 Tax=Streptomyces sp. URMC 123 TaxID=3423403 RepID=UPI003F1AFC72
MPLGRHFDAVRLAATTVHEVADDTRPHLVRAALGVFQLCGPVIRTPRAYYVLVPPGTAGGAWSDAGDGADCLGDGNYLGVPGPGDHPAVGCQWLVEPDGTGRDLTSPDAVRAFLGAARRREGAPA